MRDLIRALSDTWYCFYCGAGFGSQVELGAHLASCSKK